MSLEGAAAGRHTGSIITAMVIDMNESQVRTLEQVRQVLAGTTALEFGCSQDDAERYAWIGSVLKRLGYRQLKRADRGAVLAYLQRLSGYPVTPSGGSAWLALSHPATYADCRARQP